MSGKKAGLTPPRSSGTLAVSGKRWSQALVGGLDNEVEPPVEGARLWAGEEEAVNGTNPLVVTEQFYSGTSLWNWLRLLWENRFHIDWRYIPRALYVPLALLATLPFRIYERARFDRRIARTRIDQPPVFILGHWRSGTTYLHVLLSQDRGFACPTNLQVILPELFLGSGRLFEGAVRRFLPHKRWMDNFLLEPHLPSEDEFAIANLCPYSMYHSLAFPQNRYHYVRYCFMDDVPERVIREWQAVVLYYLKKLTFHARGRRLLLKNPM